MITYEQFIQLAEPQDIFTLNELSQGHAPAFNDGAEADVYFARIVRLNDAGFIVKASRHYEPKEGVMWQSFTAVIDPQATVYLARAAMERVIISRDPIPAQ